MPQIYLVSANPFPERPLKIDIEQRAILRRLPASWDIKFAPAAQISDILFDLRRYKPDIVHFSSHGSPMDRIVLLDAQGKPQAISRDIMDSLFNFMGENIRLVVMSACYSKTQAEEIAEFVDCVIGTDTTLNDDNSIVFGEQFYDALVAGRSVARAVEEAGILLTGIPPEHKPSLIAKAGVDPKTVYLAPAAGSKARRSSPGKKSSSAQAGAAAVSRKKVLAARKKAFDLAADRYDVWAERFSMLKIGNPDGSYFIHCEIQGLRCIRNPIEALTWGFDTGVGLVLAPDLSTEPRDAGIRWQTTPDPPPKTYDDVLKNLGILRGKFVFTAPLKPGSSRSFAWTTRALNGDALNVWEFHNLYSKAQQTDLTGEPLGGHPSEYFAQLVWFPVKEVVIGVRLPTSQVEPPKFQYFELKTMGNAVIPESQVRSGGVVRTGPDYDSEWGKANAIWRRNIDVERTETLSRGVSTDLRVDYPTTGGYYSLQWELPDPPLPPQIEQLCGETQAIRSALLAHGKARRSGVENPHSALVKQHFQTVHTAVADFVKKNLKESSFTTAFFIWNHEERRLMVVEVCRNGPTIPETEWSFWSPFGLGIAGMCFRSASGAFRYRRDLDHGTPERPENYLPYPGATPHNFLLALPIDHPKFTEELADLPNSQRSRQLVGVLSIGSYSPASPLLEYCRETLTDDAFIKLRDLRDTCQKSVDTISNLLLDSDLSGDTPPSPNTQETSALSKPFMPAAVTVHPEPDSSPGNTNVASNTSASVPDLKQFPKDGILLQPGPDWVSPAAQNQNQFKVVAFDLDGSLLRGEKYIFSWELVWRNLGIGKTIQNQLRREYHKRVDNGGGREARAASYRQWCEAAIDKFKDADLTRARLDEMAKGLRLTKNCRNALKVLRSQGMVTALISGGINVFLEEAFPDFRNYFDFVFINELVFSSFGMISGVKATAYDFEGKADALALVCGLAGVTAEQSVFVGDHYNDKTVMSYAKKAIAYPANDAVPDDVSHATVKENDLMAVLPHILVK